MSYLLLLLLLASLVWSLIAVFLCYSMARKRRRGPALWAVLGFFCGWIGVAILAISPPQAE